MGHVSGVGHMCHVTMVYVRHERVDADLLNAQERLPNKPPGPGEVRLVLQLRQCPGQVGKGLSSETGQLAVGGLSKP